MPRVSEEILFSISFNLLKSAGASNEEARVVSEHCIDANLAGHDSHGIIQIPTYLERIKMGHIVPGAPFEIIKSSETTTVIDGNWGFGYLVSKRAMEITIEKAKTHNVAATTVFRQSHVGRVASYPTMASSAGMIGLMTADSGRSAKTVAPFGGTEARLGTNPICFAMPSNLEGPLFVDMATSAAAAGKLNLAAARGNEVPEGWILDNDGATSTDPSSLKEGGVLLPLGGNEGHKGYGLSVIIEIFSGILTGLGFGHEPSGRHNDGCFMAVFNVEAFLPLKQFKSQVTEFAEYLKSSSPREGVDEVLYPGEIESKNIVKNKANGIYIEDSTWIQLQSISKNLDLVDSLDWSTISNS